MKTKITVDRHTVDVERDDAISGERSTTTYFVQRDSEDGFGYVCILDPARKYPQVCKSLGSTGSTLRATHKTLPDVLRRELRRLATIERRVTQ